MYRLALPAIVMAALICGAAEIAAGQPQRARPRGGGDGGRAGAPPPRAARPPARRPPSAQAGRPSPGRPPDRAYRPGPPDRARPGGAGAYRPGRPAGGVRTGAVRRPPDDVGAPRRAVPRRGWPPAGGPGYRGDPGGRYPGGQVDGRGGGGWVDGRGGRYGQRPGRYAVPRSRVVDDGGYRRVHRPRFFYPQVYGTYFHLPGYAFDLHFGYPWYYGPRWGGYGYPYWPYDRPYYPYYDYEDPYTGYLRLKVKPRAAEVYVDGYYVGLVDHFDGVFQRLKLVEGPRRVEIRHPAYRTLEIEVLIVARSKVTYEALLEPR